VIENEVLVDGGIIANNPAFYSYIHAVEWKKKNPKKLRIISIGTGEVEPEVIDPHKATVMTWITLLGTFLTVSE